MLGSLVVGNTWCVLVRGWVHPSGKKLDPKTVGIPEIFDHDDKKQLETLLDEVGSPF